MVRSPRPRAAQWLPALIPVVILAAVGRAAAQTEVREFAIRVDGSPAGTYRMTIQPGPDGAVTLTAQAEAKVKVLLVTAYRYSYHGVEVWKDGRLVRFDSSGAENGKKFAISAAVEGDRLRVTANGQQYLARRDAWVNTYWQLPEERYRGREVPLLGCDTGKEESRLLQHVGTQRITVAGQSHDCAHYRIHTTPPHDLWFDATGRLVRQEWLSPEGHRSVLELTRVSR